MRIGSQSETQAVGADRAALADLPGECELMVRSNTLADREEELGSASRHLASRLQSGIRLPS
jgi:hypothetical protein